MVSKEDKDRNKGGRPKGYKKTGGRQKGTPNKLTADVKDMIVQALSDAGGVGYLVRQAEENPRAFLALVGRVLPYQVQGDSEKPLSITIVRGLGD